MKEYAILYKKQVYDVEKGIIFLKPHSVLEGIKDNENHVFLASSNEKINFLGDDSILSSKTVDYVSNTLTEAELLEYYPQAKNIKEAKNLLLQEKKDLLIIGVYRNNRLNVGNILIDDFVFDLAQDERNLDDPSYQTLKNRFEMEDFTFLSREELVDLLNINSLDELREQMKYIMNHKETYQEKITSCQVVYVLDNNFQDTLCLSEIEEIKEFLTMCLNNSDMKRQEDINKEGLTLLDFYQENFNCVLFVSSLEEMKYVLNKILDNYKVVFSLLENLGMPIQEYEACKKVLTVQYVTIEKILKSSNLEQMISDYKSSYNAGIDSIIKMNDLLNQYDFLLIPKEEDILIDEVKDFNIEDKIVFDYLKTYQYMISKVIRRNEQIDAILSTIDMVDNNPNVDKKQACLIAGTTGTGKTQTFIELKRAIQNRPIVLTDTNQITQQGYVGGTIEEIILEKLVEEAHRINQSQNETKSSKITAEDIALAEHGVVFLDEIDKRRENETSSADVNGKGVIDQLLKMMDGTTYEVNIGGNSIIDKKTISFDTSNLVIFAGGAFQEYFDLDQKQLGYFQTKDSDKFTKYLEVNPEELVKYGLSSQFIGRFNRAILYPPHTKETLLELENNKSTSNIENKRRLFDQLDVRLVWEDDFLQTVVDEAIKLKKGGRGLNHIISRCLDNVYSEIKKYPGEYKIIYLNADMVKNPEEVILIKSDDTLVRMKAIKERNIQLEKDQYQIAKVEMDQEAYLEAISMLEDIRRKEQFENIAVDDKQKQYTLKKVDY